MFDKVMGSKVSSCMGSVRNPNSSTMDPNNSSLELFSPDSSSKPSISSTFSNVDRKGSHNFSLGISPTSSKISIESFSWNRMQSICMQHNFSTVEDVTLPIIKSVSQVLEMLRKNIAEVCFDLYTGIDPMSDKIVDKFEWSVRNDPNKTAKERAMIHYVILIYFHSMILEHLSSGNKEFALNLLKQIAINHGLIGITPADFRMMDLLIIRYLLSNRLVSEETSNHFVVYLNLITTFITNYQDSQSIRQHVMTDLTFEENQNYRHSKARENYRLMKQWKKNIEVVTEKVRVFEEQWNRNNASNLEDTSTIDTEELKENDFIMKYFVKNKSKDNK